MTKENTFLTDFDLKTTAAIVLAAGKGTRIGQHLPKVLYSVVGKPLLYYTLDLINKIKISKIFVVVGFKAIDVMGSIRNEEVNYIYQKEQLGTADAVKIVLPELPKEIKNILVMYGDDSAFFETFTIRDFIKSHKESGAVLSLMTAKVENPSGLGRIIRDEKGGIVDIREEINATPKEKEIKEINVGCYIFKVDWLTNNITKIKKNNLGEYYLTDLISVALEEENKINIFQLADTDERQGVNTLKELEAANKKMLLKLVRQKDPTVFIIDLDNTLLDTDAVKEYVNKKLVPKMIPSNLLKIFWDEYEATRNRMGFVSISDFSDSFANRVKDPSFSEKVRKLFYTIPFEKFVYNGVYGLIEFLEPRGEIVIFSEGDLVYQPMKIKSLSFSKNIDDMFVFENRSKNVEKLIEIYKNRRKILIDDKITRLETFKGIAPDAITIHVKQGIYKNLLPKSLKFKADYVAENIPDVLKYLREIC
jgi:NDP-sugar pyrophosphorylase family protein